MANNDGPPPNKIHIDGEHDSKTNWLAWIALIAGLLALLLALSRCDREPDEVVAAPENISLTEPEVPAATVAGVGGLGAYLGGTDAVPRTFAFETLNFDTGKSDIRDQDRAELTSIGDTLKQNATTRIRVVGYADARGSDPANAALGKARADSVKQALVTGGIAGDRIETASGGEDDPVADNQTGSGQAANRRTELVVLQR